MLQPVRPAVPDRLGDRPAVVIFRLHQQPADHLAAALPGLPPGKAPGHLPQQVRQQRGPPTIFHDLLNDGEYRALAAASGCDVVLQPVWSVSDLPNASGVATVLAVRVSAHRLSGSAIGGSVRAEGHGVRLASLVASLSQVAGCGCEPCIPAI